MNLVVKYDSIASTSGSDFDVRAIVEGKGANGSLWRPLIELRKINQDAADGTTKIAEISPAIFDSTGGGTVDEGLTSYHFRQSHIPDQWRVRLILTESKFGTADAFSSMTVSIYGDRYSK